MEIKLKQPEGMTKVENDSSAFLMSLKMFGDQLLNFGIYVLLVSRMGQFRLKMSTSSLKATETAERNLRKSCLACLTLAQSKRLPTPKN